MKIVCIVASNDNALISSSLIIGQMVQKLKVYLRANTRTHTHIHTHTRARFFVRQGRKLKKRTV